MYAIFEAGGKQHRVSPGDKLRIEKIENAIGHQVTFDRVLMVGGEGDARVGQPLLAGATVEAEVTRQALGDKVIVFKRRRRKGFHKKRGHRQPYTEVKITAIKG
ncbi:MAG: 50S ribosomal protein L21 [Deltaproteobacteria bacterium]|nr:50S ribosomal protein L21 [Deltaproteobacteria bacterium]